MAVHVPLSEEAQEEARTIMLSSLNLLKPATGAPIATPSKDIVLGCYWMTHIREEDTKKSPKVYGSFDDATLAYDMGVIAVNEGIKVRVGTADYMETCAGRILFNNVLPEDFKFVNEDLDSKVLGDITYNIFSAYGSKRTAEILDDIKSLGFLYATLSGVSWSMDDLVVPKEKPKMMEEARKKTEVIRSQFNEGLLSVEERRYKIIEVWQQVRQELTALVPGYLNPKGSVSVIVNSKARGSWSQIYQMAGMKGLVVNPSGQTMEMAVEASFKEGLTPLEYFISTHGARKGTADTALRTATAGYLTRRLVDVAQNVIVQEEDCGDKGGFEIARADAEATGQNFIEKIMGRTLLFTDIDKKVSSKVIDLEKAKEIDESKVQIITIRSAITCKSISGICVKCHGWDLGHNTPIKVGEAIGVVAAQAIGEPGTQLTMRTFHTGGVAGSTDITQGLPRVEEIFEARAPKGKADISEVQGKVHSVEMGDEGRIVKIKVDENSLKDIKPKRAKRGKISEKKKKEEEAGIVEYVIPRNVAVLVEKGDLVGRGQQLSEGNIDLHSLYEQTDRRTVEKYIIHSIQKIYTSQGANIHDKHIEIIVRQMFSKARITNVGDSTYAPGEVKEFSQVREENAKLKKAGKKVAEFESVLLGVTKAALASPSFLAAASFQETSRVLIDTAIMGREDKLVGLKENVIIGKMIPAGTGYRK